MENESLCSPGKSLCCNPEVTDTITEFDKMLWYGKVDQVRVTRDGKLHFIFKDGTVFEE